MVAESKAPGQTVAHFDATNALDELTTVVLDDEPCYMLTEANLMSADSRERRRYQLLRIVRGDKLVTAYVDLGPSKNFTADEFNMLGGLVVDGRGQADHTVAELRAGADELRSRKPERPEPSDLAKAFHTYLEEKPRRARHQSTFGYKGDLVR